MTWVVGCSGRSQAPGAYVAEVHESVRKDSRMLQNAFSGDLNSLMKQASELVRLPAMLGKKVTAGV